MTRAVQVPGDAGGVGVVLSSSCSSPATSSRASCSSTASAKATTSRPGSSAARSASATWRLWPSTTPTSGAAWRPRWSPTTSRRSTTTGSSTSAWRRRCAGLPVARPRGPARVRHRRLQARERPVRAPRGRPGAPARRRPSHGRSAGQRTSLCRIGGEEFAVILPGADRCGGRGPRRAARGPASPASPFPRVGR